MRSRRSSRCSRMNTTKTATMPVVASGAKTVASTFSSTSKGPAGGWCTSTGTGSSASLGTLPEESGGAGVVSCDSLRLRDSCAPRLFSAFEARSMKPASVAAPRTDSILWPMVT